MMNSLHPDFRRHAPALIEIIECAKDLRPEPEKLDELICEDDDWKAAYQWALAVLTENRVTGLGGSVFAVPLLHPDVCRNLVGEAMRLGEQYGHRPNLEEEGPYQIPEIVVEHADKELHAELVKLIRYLNVWFMLIYQMEPASISSIQFAKYEPSGTGHGNWHNDRDSSFTAVVSLAPDLFDGGGTDIMLSPVDYFSIPALPAGYALILNGKQIRHRGRQVTAGERHLLVYWLDDEHKEGA